MTENLAATVQRARDHFADGTTRDPEHRRGRLKALEDVLQERREDVLQALADDLGKPGLEAYLSEYHFLLQEIRLVRRKLKKWLKRKRVMAPPYFWPCRSWIEREPYGVVLVMAPWNYPFQLALSPVVAAIAAGNTVVLKPSEMAPASETIIREIVEAVFSPGEVAVVTGGVETAKALLEEKFDFIFFTGSTAVGREVALKAADSLTPMLLELGGKCPCLVEAGVDLEITARRVVAGKFFNGGQTCFAPDFVMVEESIRREFTEACRKVMAEVPWTEEMAHMISAKHARRIRSLIGENVLVFGEDDESRDFIAPRILPEASWDDEVMQEEIFGPVLPVVGFSGEDELQERLRSLEKPLALYCFTRRAEFLKLVQATLASGSICVNDTMKQFAQMKLPLGGVGESGFGRYRGRFGVEALSYQRAMTKRYFTRFGPGEVLPPYEKTYRWMRRFLK